jgi:hypothetical protein
MDLGEEIRLHDYSAVTSRYWPADYYLPVHGVRQRSEHARCAFAVRPTTTGLRAPRRATN